MKPNETPTVNDYEQIALSFISTVKFLLDYPSDVCQKLDKIVEQFDLIANEPGFSLVLDDILILIIVPNLQNTIDNFVKNSGKNITIIALLGIVIKCLLETLPGVILQSFQYRLKKITADNDEEIYTANSSVISLYLVRVFTLICRDYWEEFEELNHSFKDINFQDKCSLSYPSLDKYVEVAYAAGQFFAVALVKHHLNLLHKGVAE